MASGLGWLGAGAGVVMLAGAAAFGLGGWNQATVPDAAGQSAMSFVSAPPEPVAKPGPVAKPRPQPQPKPGVAAQVVPAAVAVPDDSFTVKRVLTIDGPFRHGDYVWDAEGVPDGPLVITVDIGAQTLSVFRGGYEIGAAVILFGADNKPTPLGVFPITQKNADHVSNLYNVPMPYMMRLTNDGVAIHGSSVERDSATNGCIGVPTEFARLLFGVARLGDRVIVTNGKMLELGGRIT